ncbi:hypothetical protein [Ruminococcus sp.]|uniref:hypothetical protein n=1 Tax=Ruminococcus sp. TaxID=41978 RepID=UPI0025D8CC62|nr:hypothetical protein [Ruminococcus sp.]MCR4638486.1 hypothetical protein [Ruminococcus sp.]
MKNGEDKKVKDIRRDYFKELINDVFQITTIKCDKGMDEKTPTTVILGKGTPLKDCSFKATDSKKYEDLFIATFVDKECVFMYKGTSKTPIEFSRDKAIANAVDFFKMYDIHLNYVFHSQTEKSLFSRMIYRYIKQLLNVLFYNYQSEDTETINDLFEVKYRKALDKLRDEANTLDIYELIYKNTHWSDAEFITYKGVKPNDCDSIMLVENFYDLNKSIYHEDIDRCVHMRPSDRRTSFIYNDENYYMSYELYRRKDLPIKYHPIQRYIPVEIIDLSEGQKIVNRLDNVKYVPKFVCIAFRKKDIEDDLKKASEKDKERLVKEPYLTTFERIIQNKKDPVIINNLEDLGKAVYNKLETYVQIEYISKMYTAERKLVLTPIEQVVILIKKLIDIDYKRFFDDVNYIPEAFSKGFERFMQFLKKHKIKVSSKEIIYKYLISLWISGFSDRLDGQIAIENVESYKGKNFNQLLEKIEELTSIQEKEANEEKKDELTITQEKEANEEMKDELTITQEKEANEENKKDDILKEANKLFISFYTTNKEEIDKFNKQTDVSKKENFENEFEYCLDRGYSPYLSLRQSLVAFSKILRKASSQ